MKEWEKTWFSIDGTLEELDFKGEDYFRFPVELAEMVINRYSKKGDRVLDPFCGLGTTLVAANNLGRQSVGFEKDEERANFSNSRMSGNVIQDSAIEIAKYELEPFDLVFTSPPYLSFDDDLDPQGKLYVETLTDIFNEIKPFIKEGAYIVIEIANLRRNDRFVPQAWEVGIALSNYFTLTGEVIRCNTSDVDSGGGNNHSYLLIFRK